MLKCYQCRHRRRVPGESHIRCAKPDPDMTGNAHGIKHGWFFYPLLFDPVWGEKECANFEENRRKESAAEKACFKALGIE